MKTIEIMSRKTCKKPVTVTTIAEQLKLSPSTVSFVLSGKAKERAIGEKTAQRVREMAEKLEYVPNYWARSLRVNRSRVITVLFDHLTNNWADNVLQGVSQIAQKKQYMQFVATSWLDKNKLDQALLAILQRQDEGVISSSYIMGEKECRRLTERKIPIVLLGVVPRALSGMSDLCTVTWDDNAAVKMLIKHLYERGRRRIAFAGVKCGLSLEDSRCNGYIEGLEEVGLEMVPERIALSLKDPPDFAGMLAKAFGDKNRRPDAIIAMTDGIAFQVWRDLDRMGMRVPDDVALAGMGGWQKLIVDRVGLTTVVEPLNKMGQIAAQMLLSRIENPSGTGSIEVVSSEEFYLGKTS